MSVAERIAVVIGVGEINDRPDDGSAGLDSFELMKGALTAAEKDCGALVLGRLDWLGVVDQISFPETALHERLADALPQRPKRLVITAEPSGDGPVRLLNDAANLIASGEVGIAAIVGGEALRTAVKRAQRDPSAAARAAAVSQVTEALALPMWRKFGLVSPADVYALYENATRAQWGQTLAEAQQESAEIWSGFSKTAASNSQAWLHTPLSPAEILQPSSNNRLISFPYRKLMVANSAVNQGAAAIVTSLAMARMLGFADEDCVYVGAGAAAHEPGDFLQRDGYGHIASLSATIQETLRRNSIDRSVIDVVELYSCFPCIPKLARREIGWPLEKPHSVYGGLTFGGGPIANCMTHAIAAMVRRLRMDAKVGLIVANGGYATHSHSIVLARRPPPPGVFPQDYDVQALADGIRGRSPRLLEDYQGPGRLETFAIPFDRSGEPRCATVIARTLAGERFLASVPADDYDELALLQSTESPVGRAGRAIPGADGRAIWRSHHHQ